MELTAHMTLIVMDTVKETKMHEELVEKFAPKHLRVSGEMTAILGCLLNHPEWSEPQMHELIVTSDGCLLGRKAGDCGANEFFALEDLIANLSGIIAVLKLDAVQAKTVANIMQGNMISFNPTFDLAVSLGLA